MATTIGTSLDADLLAVPTPPLAIRALRASATFVRGKPLGAFGALMLILVLVVGLLSPWIAPYGHSELDTSRVLDGPSADHWFGVDHNGRDVYSRIVFGAQVTALVGVGTVLLTGLLSLAVGVISGFFGGRTDFGIQRLVDVWMSFPAIFLILTLVAVLQTSSGWGFFGLRRGPEWGPDPQGGDWIWFTMPRTTIVILALGLVLAGGASRVVRSAVLGVKAFPYVDAAVVIGASSPRIITRHILPNIMATVIVLSTVQLGVAILAEATISFLGVGITNFPTWGQMLSGRTRDLAENNPHLAIFPGFAIFFAVFGFNMLGDALRDVLDPRLRGSG